MAELIAAGHRWPDILEYTLKQIEIFYAQAHKHNLRARADKILDGAISFHSPDKQRQKFIKQLLDG